MTASKSKLTKIPQVINYIRQTYIDTMKELGKDVTVKDFMIANQSSFPSWTHVELLQKMPASKKRKNKVKYNIDVNDIIQCNQDIIPSYYGNVDIICPNEKYSKKLDMSINNRHGIYIIKLTIDGSPTCLVIADFVLNHTTQNATHYRFAAFKSEDLYKFTNGLKSTISVLRKPKFGIYRVTFSSLLGLVLNKYTGYSPKNLFIENNVGKTESTNNIINGIDIYFNNLPKVIAGKPNIKKYLFYGDPGTGKTTFSLELLNKYSKTHVCGICTDFISMANFIILCTYYNLPFIVVLEEVDEYTNLNSKELGSIKNFMDGSDLPVMQGFLKKGKRNDNIFVNTLSDIKNKPSKDKSNDSNVDFTKWSGGCIIYITNHPDRISYTIRNRRTGESVKFGKLNYADKDDFIDIMRSVDKYLKEMDAKNYFNLKYIETAFRNLEDSYKKIIYELSYQDIYQLCEKMVIDMIADINHDNTINISKYQVSLSKTISYLESYFAAVSSINNFKSKEE